MSKIQTEELASRLVFMARLLHTAVEHDDKAQVYRYVQSVGLLLNQVMFSIQGESYADNAGKD